MKFILIDGSGLIYRGFYGIPPFFKSPAGVQTNAVFGFTSILLSLLTTQKPDFMAVAFDKKGATFRHEEYKEYKATRVKAPQELYDQIPLVKDLVRALRLPAFEVTGFEADDIIATVAQKLPENVDMYIASGDFDVFQVAGPHVSILYPTKGFKDAETFHVADIEKKYGLTPSQIPDYKGLAGDHSDNIPGVSGIGPVGAKSLLQKYTTLTGVYEHLEEIGGAMRKKLAANRERAFMSKRLATLRYDVPVDFSLEDCRVKNFNAASARKTFEELGFKSLLKRLDELYKPNTAASVKQEALF